jgi:predicted ATPase
VTFLFTDIEGSTRRWETEPDVMRLALAVHDGVLRAVIEAHGGWLFKHTGDGVCAAFASAHDAVDAAVEAQRGLGLPVRMGMATGEAEERDGDYFGPPLNRAARVMAAGHGGQILVAASTAELVHGIELLDLGEHRLRDLSGAIRLFQVEAEGLGSQFAPLRTVDAVPGNLPMQVTSFVGRDADVNELAELVRAHRLVTLTGVGGVGKTRLALQVAAELVATFPDGVWSVELAPVEDSAAVPDVVANVLRVSAQAGLTVTESISKALSGRQMLIVLDNCEHVLDAAARLVETILGSAETVHVMATSREGLRVRAEHLWPVPSLDVQAGADSAAVELFVERARAVSPGFELGASVRAAAVIEICRRLDGIALAIELAAARMVSMSAEDVRDRLGDRFRFLSTTHRGQEPEHHQTLRRAVQWSYDLLDDDERVVLARCSVFADGFDLAAATRVSGGDALDEYTMLDLLDSLVRKSLVTVDRSNGHARYGLLETIREFAAHQLASTGTTDATRDRHARYFAERATACWDMWDGPQQRVAVDWVDAEFANLRVGFRWAADQHDLVSAAAIAAHTTLLNWALQRFEPAGWAEAIIPAAEAIELRQLPRLYTAASLCMFTGRPEAAVGYAQRAVALEADPGFDSFEAGWGSAWEASAHLNAGRIGRCLEIYAELAARPGLARVVGLCGTLYVLPVVGRADDARTIADETLTAAHAHGNPFWIAWALAGSGRAFTQDDPGRALAAYRQGLTYAQEHRLPVWEARLAREAAGLEAVHGEVEQALALFDATLDAFHHAGDVANAAVTLTHLAVFFDRIERPEIAATIYGTSTNAPSISMVTNLPGVLDHLRLELGETVFDDCVAKGAALESAHAVHYARDQIRLTQRQLGVASSRPQSRGVRTSIIERAR